MDLHGAYFGVAEGSLFVLDPDSEGISQRAGEEAANSEWRAANALFAVRYSPP